MKITLTSPQGTKLAGRLDEPDGDAKTYAVLAHCFTCSKDLPGLSRIARGLLQEGIGVLRLDFMGLGESGGEFEDGSFTADVEAVIAAGDWLAAERKAPTLLVGHSMGGAVSLVAARQLESVQAVATIGAPAEAQAVTRHFASQLQEVRTDGRAEVVLAGRTFVITREFLEDLESQEVERAVEELALPVLILHSPQDQVVPVDHGTRLFQAARNASFLSLDGADHLLGKPGIGEWVGRITAFWWHSPLHR